tara:strand:- start:39998 stop:40750 length:753 start_codon:yes stop_codon:yes gene_type:complete
MQYGICPLSVVPVRLIADDSSELITQLLYGDHYKIIDNRKFWSKIRNAYDGCEGWISNQQVHLISEEQYTSIQQSLKPKFSSDLVSFVATQENILIPLVLGSSIADANLLDHKYEGNFIDHTIDKNELIHIASLYLNAPFLCGGKTPFGIDCSGFTQMVYKITGHNLLRNASQQATQGEPLSFIEESEPGDLAFFDNNDGVIDHVGIIMQNNYIIHSSGRVRIDRIDHTGIFNVELKSYTHKLRVIKKII